LLTSQQVIRDFWYNSNLRKNVIFYFTKKNPICLGAMENWGLVTYRETALLVDPENTSTQSKEYVAIVVGHELAHQWFGNIVTMVPNISSNLNPIPQEINLI
jgi:hypothetical protein